jgi:predicted RNA-binding Zn ribbon-like protein
LHFAPDTEDALAFVVALGNTVPGASRSGDDELATIDQLAAFVERERYSGRIDRDAAELRDVIATRELLRRVWMRGRDDMALELNAILADAHAMPYLLRHDGFDWHLHATARDAPLAERIRVEASIALVDVIRSDETGRLRVCEADDCEGLLLDLSRNGSKRFCSVRCGNRMNMVAFRRRAETGGVG